MAQAQPPLSSLKNILRGCLIEMGGGGGGGGGGGSGGGGGGGEGGGGNWA